MRQEIHHVNVLAEIAIAVSISPVLQNLKEPLRMHMNELLVANMI